MLAAGVRAGRIAPGPVLSLLRTFPRVIGLAFGAFGEASPDVHTLLAHAATVGAARMWRTMGARSMLEARGFLVSQLRRTWGVAAVRAAARLRASRAVFIGMEPRVAQACSGLLTAGRWTRRCSWLALRRLLITAAAERLWGRWVPWVPGASAVPCRLPFRLGRACDLMR